MPEQTHNLLPAEELFALYPALATRVTHLRTILQNIETTPTSDEAVIAWTADVKSVLSDFMTLADQTASILQISLLAKSLSEGMLSQGPKEPSC